MDKKVDRSKVLETMLVFVLVAVIFHLVALNKGWIWLHEKEALIAAIVLAGIGLYIKPLARLIHRSWMGLSHGIGGVMSKVILSIIFFFTLTPLALIKRITSKDKLQLKRKGEDGSYYVDRNHTYKADDLKNVW